MRNLKYLIVIAVIILLTSCASKSFTKSPVDDYVKKLSDEKSYSIILYDMDVEGTFFKTYKHQYKIISVTDSIPSANVTRWYEVSKDFFRAHENDMGMAIVTKTEDGKVSKVASPPGYANYVGNNRYGYWNNSGGSSFWVFYGQYALMRDLLGWGSYRVGRNTWNDYDRNYRRSSKPYYGAKTSTGARTFGTRSTFAKKTNPSSTWNQKMTARRSRNSSRYSTSGSRSRSSRGFGK